MQESNFYLKLVVCPVLWKPGTQDLRHTDCALAHLISGLVILWPIILMEELYFLE